MTDEPIGSLTPVGAFATTQEFPVNDSGTTKKLTGAQLLAVLPQGTLGYAEATVAQTGIGATETDLTSLTVTVTVGNSRRIRVSGWIRYTQNTSTGIATCAISELGSDITAAVQQLTATGQANLLPVRILQPASGSHTYKLTLKTSAGTVDALHNQSTGHILVEDIGT